MAEDRRATFPNSHKCFMGTAGDNLAINFGRLTGNKVLSCYYRINTQQASGKLGATVRHVGFGSFFVRSKKNTNSFAGPL